MPDHKEFPIITDIRVPLLSVNDAMALLVERYVEDGEQVAAGQELCLIETSKVTQPITAERSGYVRWCAQPGNEVEVKALIGWLADAPEEQPAAASAGAASTGEKLEATQKAVVLAAQLGVRLDEVPRVGSIIREKDVRAFAQRRPLAGQNSDVVLRQHEPARETPIGGMSEADRATQETPNGPPQELIQERRALPRAQRLINAAMRRSLSANAHAYVALDACVDGLEAMLQALTQSAGAPIRLNDAVLYATARALAHAPTFNGCCIGDELWLYNTINLGFVVEREGLLLVPVIQDAQRKTLAVLAQESALLQMKVARNTLGPSELDGGTFTVTNLAGTGVQTFVPIIHGFQAAILAVGAVERRAVKRGMSWEEATFLRIGLSYDHRINHGMAAARLLRAIAAEIEVLIQPELAQRDG